MDFSFIPVAGKFVIQAAPVTLGMAIIGISIGILVAVVLTFLRRSGVTALSIIAESYVFTMRGTPLLIQLYIFYYGLAQFNTIRTSFVWPLIRDPFLCACLVFGLNAAAYIAEMIRGAINSVPLGQTQACRAFGMSTYQAYRRVIGPQAIQFMLPNLGNQMIFMIKNTALASTITVMEMTGVAQQLMSASFAAFEVFIAAGVLYLLLNMVLTIPISLIEGRIRK